MKTLFSFCLGLLVILIGCAHGPAATPTAPAPVETSWDAFTTGYLNRFFAAHPEEAVGAGRHEYDGQLPENCAPD